ncbi:MAG: hypothetical protein OEW25_09550 [Nitrospira sp.]|nr:hypothetical protein [Nitrospira sp.]MDH5253558.1 hypothetical protein [Nitrospira sp.]
MDAIAVHSEDHEYKGSESAVIYGFIASPLRAKCAGHRSTVEVFCGNGAGIHVAECRNANVVVCDGGYADQILALIDLPGFTRATKEGVSFLLPYLVRLTSHPCNNADQFRVDI